MSNINPLYEAYSKRLPFLSRVGNGMQEVGYSVNQVSPYVLAPIALGTQILVKNPVYKRRVAGSSATAASIGHTLMGTGRLLRGISARIKGHGRSLDAFQRMIRDRDIRKQSRKAAEESITSHIKKGAEDFVKKRIPIASKLMDDTSSTQVKDVKHGI